MSKAGAVGRGLYATLAFLVNALLRVGINLSLVAAIAVTVYAMGAFSREALKQRKEGKCCRISFCAHLAHSYLSNCFSPIGTRRVPFVTL
ncbi:unnamed protein product [Strongylus vulgaris]|uniref:Uncharacterized protein n=1 Tax=Strongylus vulgaris TaxID=40348 RepID=A0A3P7J5S8_STRVU|nr:unnamed protein product [Strongylus vulgaris]